MIKSKSIMQSNVFRIALGTGVILMIPLLFRFPWMSSDFIVAGAALFITGFLLDLVLEKAGKYKVMGVLAIVLLFHWLWVELAVGLFTNWGS